MNVRDFLLVVVSVWTSAIQGQDEVILLDPIQVTAGRRADASFSASQPLTVLEGEEVTARNPQVLTEALRYEPGAFVQQSGPGQGIVIVRGLKGSEVLHLVDGMRLNNAFFRNSPSQYVGLVDPQNVAHVELLRGPYGTLYGSDAMGGVLQVLTPEHRFSDTGWNWRGTARGHYGSADLARTARTELAAGTRTFSIAGGMSLSAFGKRLLAQPGQSPDGQGGITMAKRVSDTEYLSRAYDLKALWAPSESHESMLSVQSFEIPELQRYFQTVPGFSDAPSRSIAAFENDRILYHARYRYRPSQGPIQGIELHLARQIMTDNRHDRLRDNSRDEFAFNRSTLDGLTLQAHSVLKTHELLYGAEIYRDKVESHAYRESPPDSGNLTFPDGVSFFAPFPDGSVAIDIGLYMHDRWAPDHRWVVESGLRYSTHTTRVAKSDRAFGAKLNNDDITASVGVRYALTASLAWTANLGRGFRVPNLFDLALVGQRANDRVVVANLELKPEQVVTVDTGFKLLGKSASAEASIFYSDYEDRIVTVNSAFAEGTPECPADGDVSTDGCSQNQNIARSRYYGLEVGLRYQVTPTVGIRQVINSTWGDQEQAGRKSPANRVPPLNGQIAVEYQGIGGWRIEPSAFFADRQDRLDANDRADSRIDPSGTPGYLVFNLRARGNLAEQLTLQVDLTNLANASYREHGSGIDARGRGVGLTVGWTFAR